MNVLLDKKQSRREFFRTSIRYLVLGGLVSTAGTLITKRKLASAEEKYTDTGICQSCNLLKNCDLPRALLARKEMARW